MDNTISTNKSASPSHAIELHQMWFFISGSHGNNLFWAVVVQALTIAFAKFFAQCQTS
jgi:hypothetical protein